MKRKVVKLLSISVNNMRMTTALFRPWLEILTFPIWLSSFDENNGLLPNKRNRADGYRKGKVHKFGHSKLEILFSNQSKLSKIFLKYKGKLKIEIKTCEGTKDSKIFLGHANRLEKQKSLLNFCCTRLYLINYSELDFWILNCIKI